jgi:hypothetical protein
MSFARVQRLVDIDENIFSAFVIDPTGSISELFIAPDSDVDKSKIEKIKSILNIKSATVLEREAAENLVGKHKWDIMEFDKYKIIKLYPSGNLEHKMIVVSSKLETISQVVRLFIILKNSSSSIFFLLAAQDSTSLP